MTRRAGLRVKAFFGGNQQDTYDSIISFTQPNSGTGAPTSARVAQATTIVVGGVTASLAAEIAGRPFRACQRIMQTESSMSARPIMATYRAHGIRPFISSGIQPQLDMTKSRARRAAQRIGWRLAAVGPWGFGFLVWAWVGGEI